MKTFPPLDIMVLSVMGLPVVRKGLPVAHSGLVKDFRIDSDALNYKRVKFPPL